MRPHAELIKRCADDETLEIEGRYSDRHRWQMASTYALLVYPDWQFRIKPKPLAKVKMWKWAIRNGTRVHATGEYYKNMELIRLNQGQTVICRIEGSMIEVEE